VGRLSKEVKNRQCRSCSRVLLVNAKDMKAHWEVCYRVKTLGIEIPTQQVIRPGGVILTDRE